MTVGRGHPMAAMIESQFFAPEVGDPGSPAALGLAFEPLRFAADDGSALGGWWLPAASPARGVVLQAHGNGAHRGNHLPYVAWLPAAGWHVLSFDYRGYGDSGGTPTLDGVVRDTVAALAVARQRAGALANRLVVLGQSLGGSTAARAVATSPQGVQLLVVDCAYDSYYGIARDVAAGTPMAAMLPLAREVLPPPHDDPVAAIARLAMPVLVVHAKEDEVVPVAHGRRLHAAAPRALPMIEVPGASHCDTLTRSAVCRQVLDAMNAAVAHGATTKD